MKTIYKALSIVLVNILKKNILFFLFLMIFILNGFSQTHYCSEYDADKEAERKNPDALGAKTELEAFTKQFSNNQKSEITYIIPIVFHVLHNYGSENISKEQIVDAVRILNEDYNKLNADTSAIIPAFQTIAANVHLEFRLARIDPNGNCTDGIVRLVTAATYNADDNSKAVSPAWPRSKYLNVWTCNSIGSGAAGYSMYPSSAAGSWGAGVDGVMILSSYIGSIGTGSYFTGRALTHEVGHYLNLPHTWGNSNQPGTASNCSIDDGVADTPNTIGHTSCALNANTCGELDNVQNYMDYSYCSNMFTEGQKARMRAAINSSVSNRNNLWTASNLIATGTNDGYITQVCVPVPDFSFNKSSGCDNLTVQFNQLVWNVDTGLSVQWSFLGGTPSVSSDLNPSIIYTAAGSYSASLTASTINGSNQITKSNIIQIQDPTVGEGVPWIEGFESPTFPVNANDTTKNWFVSGNASANWTKVSGVSYSGSSAVRVVTASNTAGETSELYSPNIVFAGNNPGNLLTFRLAFSQKTSTDNDKLQIYFSYNCGQTWYLRYAKTGAALATNGGVMLTSFTPSLSDWRKESISLNSTYLTKPNFKVKFVFTSGGGNSIFIDDINLEPAAATSVSSVQTADALTVYPNPVTNESAVYFEINETSLIHLNLTNVLGQQLASFNTSLDVGSNKLQLNKFLKTDLQKGIYFLTVTINGKSVVLKLIK